MDDKARSWNSALFISMFIYLLLGVYKSCSAGQKILRLSLYPIFHYHVHNYPPLLSILSQDFLIHILTIYSCRINFRIILPSTRKCPNWQWASPRFLLHWLTENFRSDLRFIRRILFRIEQHIFKNKLNYLVLIFGEFPSFHFDS
jgi:hypothetical protein